MSMKIRQKIGNNFTINKYHFDNKKGFKLILAVSMTAKFISGSTSLIARLCHPFGHIVNCEKSGREARTSFLYIVILELVIFG